MCIRDRALIMACRSAEALTQEEPSPEPGAVGFTYRMAACAERAPPSSRAVRARARREEARRPIRRAAEVRGLFMTKKKAAVRGEEKKRQFFFA